MRQQYGGPKLPKELRDRIGDPANTRKRNDRRGGHNGGPMNRKERRKAERLEKKSQPLRGRVQSGKRHQNAREAETEDDFEGFDDEDEPSPPRPVQAQETQKPPKSILKKTTQSTEAKISSERSPTPSTRISRAVKDRLEQEDAEIRALEKKLGVRKKKKNKAKDDDDLDLDDIFGDLGASDSGEETLEGPSIKRKRTEDDDWLASKRRKALGSQAEENITGSDIEDDLEAESEELYEQLDDNGSELDDADDMDNTDQDTDGDSETEEDGITVEQPRVRENPYVAPVSSSSTQAPAKYVPPALRGLPSSDAEALARLKRQIQGLLNRLTEANLLTILRDIEQVYQNNARGYVNTTLIDLLIGLLADETTLMDTFLIQQAGIIAAIYKVIGTDFGAQLVERIVSVFDNHYQTNKAGNGKHATNLISLVAQLYNFQVIGSNLVFDYIRLFLDELSEINTELLLRIVRISGPQLRQDDAASLKDIVLLLQKSVAKVGETNLDVRTKFMIESINNLKNNRVKTGVNASAIVSEHSTRMRKTLGTLNTRNLKGTEPLRIGLADVRDTAKKGKWWLVGASWRNDTRNDTRNETSGVDEVASGKHLDVTIDAGQDDELVDLLQLAREQRMNTDVRRAIFCTIMSASDFKDAHMRLLKLNLKKSQELEIPRVVVHCAGCEKNYNPYYTLLARKFCAEHKLKKTFQFTLWDTFKALGEKGDEEPQDEETNDDFSLRKLVNLGKLYGTLIANGGLTISVLKSLNFPYLQPKTKTLVEIMLITAITQSQKGTKGADRDEKALLNVFINTDQAPEMITGLQFFLRKVVSRTDIAASKAEKDTITWACKIVVDMLTRLAAATKE